MHVCSLLAQYDVVYHLTMLCPYCQNLSTTHITGPAIRVERATPDPTDEQITALHDEVIAKVKLLYEENRPAWEKNPLVVH